MPEAQPSIEILAVLLQVGASTLRVSTPLVLAALGGFFSERAGVINIALEGMMLMGAFAGAAATLKFGSPYVGALVAAGAGLITALLYALSVITLRADQIVAGTAINLLALGVTPFGCKLLYGATGGTPNLELAQRFTEAPLWFTGVLTGVVALWMRFTPTALWVRFAGEHPDALEAAGVRVIPVRFAGVALSGVLAGLAGATLSIFLSSAFARNMTAGRGFMAIAALIFGKWKPLPTAAACLLFGLADALQIRLQGVTLWGSEPVPVQFIQVLPYLATVIVLAGFVGRSRAPSALGTPYPRAR
jgi:ABC-type uncharacterized transport system permease subunit